MLRVYFVQYSMYVCVGTVSRPYEPTDPLVVALSLSEVYTPVPGTVCNPGAARYPYTRAAEPAGTHARGLAGRARAAQHEGVVDGCIRDPRTKTSYASRFFLGQASSREQLDQSNLIIFHAYMV